MLVSFTTPELNATAFSCPHCGVYAKQEWGLLYRNRLDINNGRLIINEHNKMSRFRGTSCENCHGCTIWHDDKIVFPFSGDSIQPNEDMPGDVKELFLEARSILFLSPRSAAAIARMALTKLCAHLGESESDLEHNIGLLVENGLPPKLVQALHSLKAYGRNAIKPGWIEETDDAAAAHRLLVFLNIICDNQISQPKMIARFL